MGDSCNNTQPLEVFLNNATNPIWIPKSYRSFVEQLTVDWENARAANVSNDIRQFDTQEMKALLDAYMEYHNAVL